MADKVKSGKEMLDEFFANISKIKGIDPKIAKELSDLYKNDNLTDSNLKNSLNKLREHERDEDKED